MCCMEWRAEMEGRERQPKNKKPTLRELGHEGVGNSVYAKKRAPGYGTRKGYGGAWALPGLVLEQNTD